MIGKTNSLTIIQQGGGSSTSMNPYDDVCFYDIDGKLIKTMSKDTFLALGSLPDTPDRSEDGLLNGKWVWSPRTADEALQTLPNFKNYVNSNGKLDLFVSYSVNHSQIKIYIKLTDTLTIYSHIGGVNGQVGTVNIDWGDNTASTAVTISNTAVTHSSHTYLTSGEYVISLSSSNVIRIGACDISYNSTNRPNDSTGQYSEGCEVIKKVISSKNLSLYNSSVHIKQDKDYEYVYKEYTSADDNTTGSFVIYNFYNAYHLGLPDYIALAGSFYTGTPCTFTQLRYTPTSYSIWTSTPYKRTVSRICLHSGRLYDFTEFYALVELIIDSSFTGYIGAYGRDLYSINELVLSEGCYFSNQIGRNANNLKRCINASYLSGGYCLQSVYMLEELEFASTVTAIGSSCVTNAYNLKTIKFKTANPPTVSSSCFTGIPTTCKIYVPSGSLAAYTSTANMPSSSTYTYIEY